MTDRTGLAPEDEAGAPAPDAAAPRAPGPKDAQVNAPEIVKNWAQLKQLGAAQGLRPE